MTQPLISFCIPTNGISKWVFPVLDSIYNQQIDNALFEVVVEDNGKNVEFKKKMRAYALVHINIQYSETKAHEFLSEVESYKKARGLFIKFINHRTVLKPGALQYFIDFVHINKEEKPCVYFGNGVIKSVDGQEKYSTFNDFVANLSYFSSWSTGMGFWKEDFKKIPIDQRYNVLFPHTTILFNEPKKSKYIIDNNILLDELSVGNIPKGRYNLFYAFAVEYPAIICDLLRRNLITEKTFLKVKNENHAFIQGLYFDYIVLKKGCSYNLEHYKESLDVFYSYKELKKDIFVLFVYRCFRKIMHLLKICISIGRKGK